VVAVACLATDRRGRRRRREAFMAPAAVAVAGNCQLTPDT
jgi:hypothetical protein